MGPVKLLHVLDLLHYTMFLGWWYLGTFLIGRPAYQEAVITGIWLSCLQPYLHGVVSKFNPLESHFVVEVLLINVAGNSFLVEGDVLVYLQG